MIYFCEYRMLHDKAWLIKWVRCLLSLRCINTLMICPNSVATRRCLSRCCVSTLTSLLSPSAFPFHTNILIQRSYISPHWQGQSPDGMARAWSLEPRASILDSWINPNHASQLHLTVAVCEFIPVLIYSTTYLHKDSMMRTNCITLITGLQSMLKIQSKKHAQALTVCVMNVLSKLHSNLRCWYFLYIRRHFSILEPLLPWTRYILLYTA